MPKITKYLWLLNVLLGIVLAILVGIVYYQKNATQNYCKLSEEEIIDIAIAEILKTYPPKVEFPSHDPDQPYGRYHQVAFPVYYKDVADFKSKNPNCCNILYGLSSPTYHFNKGYGITYLVQAQYDVIFLDGKAALPVKSKSVHSEYISSCGVLGFGFPE